MANIKNNIYPIQPPLPAPEYADVRVLLASASPRRRELLGLIVPEFAIASGIDVDETYPADMPAEQVPVFLSQLKAGAYATTLTPGELIITADTVVIIDGKILGKPHDRDAAIAMIEQLSGRTHTVVTGVTLTALDGHRRDSFSARTDVTFAPLTKAQIEEYVDRYMPLDKAGAYGIQEWIGAAAIERIDGSFYNVMGLPLHILYNHLRDFYRK